MKKELELKLNKKISRLTNKTFNFDKRLKDGWYSSSYFLKTRNIILNEDPGVEITMQFFQKATNKAILCGIDEAIALLQEFAVNPEELHIKALNDGDIVKKFEPVLQISGNYENFGFLEGIIDGILARRTSIATNVFEVRKAAIKKDVVFMGDRDDHYLNQQGDGYAAYIGGMTAQATNAMNEWWGKEGVGTMPHALIQHYEGNLLKACIAYKKYYPNDNLIALVDYNNNVVEDSLIVAEYFGNELFGVRVDTSELLIDKSLENLKEKNLNGVNPTLIKLLRAKLDENNHKNVKIVVSGGFTKDKIKLFEKENTPVDIYGVGSSLLKVNVGFTGDVVKIKNQKQAKFGREYYVNEKLEKVKLEGR